MNTVLRPYYDVFVKQKHHKLGVGWSDNLSLRISQHKSTYGTFQLTFAKECNNNRKVEEKFKELISVYNINRTIPDKKHPEKTHIELFTITIMHSLGEILCELNQIIKHTKLDVEYNKKENIKPNITQ